MTTPESDIIRERLRNCQTPCTCNMPDRLHADYCAWQRDVDAVYAIERKAEAQLTAQFN